VTAVDCAAACAGRVSSTCDYDPARGDDSCICCDTPACPNYGSEPDAHALPDASPDAADADGDADRPDVERDDAEESDRATEVRGDDGSARDETSAEPDFYGHEFVGLSCMSGAMCAVCCATSDWDCQMWCVGEADPATAGVLLAVVGCANASGCGEGTAPPDVPCVIEACQEQIGACTGGPGGTGGCLSLAWCLISTGCPGMATCVDAGMCYQACFGAARPEVIGPAMDLAVCAGGPCEISCRSGLTTMDCINCLVSTCPEVLRTCVG
jgi:hypothetical protein